MLSKHHLLGIRRAGRALHGHDPGHRGHARRQVRHLPAHLRRRGAGRHRQLHRGRLRRGDRLSRGVRARVPGGHEPAVVRPVPEHPSGRGTAVRQLVAGEHRVGPQRHRDPRHPHQRAGGEAGDHQGGQHDHARGAHQGEQHDLLRRHAARTSPGYSARARPSSSKLNREALAVGYNYAKDRAYGH